MIIGNREFDLAHQVYMMGILNVTPDSFSDGGRYNQLDKALYHAQEMVEQGADILDVGGESTRPGHQMVSEQEETERVVPVLEALHARFDIPLSIDTYKSGVAREAIRAGAALVNDVWGFRYDDQMALLVAETQTACCLMHNRNAAVYGEFLTDVAADLKKSVDLSRRAGVAADKVMLDPGIGFGKTYEQNLMLLGHLSGLKALGYPILLGTSRKSVIGLALNLPAEERLEGTVATTVMGVMQGCSIIRVHDIKENKRAAAMALAVREAL